MFEALSPIQLATGITMATMLTLTVALMALSLLRR